MNVISRIKHGANFVSDFWDLSDFFFVAPQIFDEKIASKVFNLESKKLLNEYAVHLQEINFESIAYIFEATKDWLISKEINFGKIAQPLRLSLVGKLKGPDIYEIVRLLGKEETIKRIEKAVTTL